MPPRKVGLAVWDIERGLQVPGGAEDAASEAGGSDPLAAIRAVNALATPDGSALLVLNKFHRVLNSAEIREGRLSAETLWQQKSQMLKKSGLLSLYRGTDDFSSLGGPPALKAFAGVAGSGQTDSGVSSRMFDAFLSWLTCSLTDLAATFFGGRALLSPVHYLYS